MTDAQLVAYRWGQRVGTVQIARVLWRDHHGQGHADALPGNELAALWRIGFAAFRYWAMRGAGVS